MCLELKIGNLNCNPEISMWYNFKCYGWVLWHTSSYHDYLKFSNDILLIIHNKWVRTPLTANYRNATQTYLNTAWEVWSGHQAQLDTVAPRTPASPPRLLQVESTQTLSHTSVSNLALYWGYVLESTTQGPRLTHVCVVGWGQPWRTTRVKEEVLLRIRRQNMRNHERQANPRDIAVYD